MKATKNHDHFHSQAKEKTDVKSLQRENLTAGQQKLFYFRTLLHQNINKPTPVLHFMLILLKC